ncbi:MAG TPA: hypothetical protein VF669_09195 [Tepidisphaeraceae bacterium]|jgi:hypothetical protein
MPATCPLNPSAPKPDPTLTVDTFIAEVPLEPHRSILVYLREHGGRQYVRWRVFHRHRKSGLWYPDKRRSFVIPLSGAAALGGAIAAATTGRAATAKPDWLEKIDAYRGTMLAKLEDLNAPPAVLEREKRRRCRGWGLGPLPRPPLSKRKSRGE